MLGLAFCPPEMLMPFLRFSEHGWARTLSNMTRNSFLICKTTINNFTSIGGICDVRKMCDEIYPSQPLPLLSRIFRRCRTKSPWHASFENWEALLSDSKQDKPIMMHWNSFLRRFLHAGVSWGVTPNHPFWYDFHCNIFFGYPHLW